MLHRIKSFLIDKEKIILKKYSRRFFLYSFRESKITHENQYEAAITRLYHTIEKGLSFIDFRPGFGKSNVSNLIDLMKEYSNKYDVNKFFYQTALSTLHSYINKNKIFGYTNLEVEQRINNLPGKDNGKGGVCNCEPFDDTSYEEFVKMRHSVRHFSSKPIDLKIIEDVFKLAQYTPSACNRQGWKSYVINNKNLIKEILNNQNGNSGFGHEFDKLILITGDLRYFNRDRELFQIFIDCGMYAMRVLDSLFYYKIASCPLSASLNPNQDEKIREILELDDAEILIMFIGIGNYPDNCLTTRSERHEPRIKII